jgi:hypothetical protein
MKFRLTIALLSCLASSITSGVEIESKNGKTFDAEIMEATKESVKVRKTGGSAVYVLKRSDLAVETNVHIETFLKNQRDLRDKEAGNKTKFELKMRGKMHRISFHAKVEDLPIVPDGLLVQFKGEEGGAISFHFTAFEANLVRGEKEVNQRKTTILRQASQRSKVIYDAVSKSLNVEKVKYGDWEGFILTGWTDELQFGEGTGGVLASANYGYFAKGEYGFTFQFSPQKEGKIKRADISKIIESMSVIKIEEVTN